MLYWVAALMESYVSIPKLPLDHTNIGTVEGSKQRQSRYQVGEVSGEVGKGGCTEEGL